MSTIKKLRNGHYQTQVYDRYGKRLRQTFSRRYEAEAYIRKIEGEKNDIKLARTKVISNRVSMQQAIDNFWQGKNNLAGKTIQKYEAIIKQINEFCSANKIDYIDQFERRHGDLYRSLLIKSGASAKTVNAYLMCLKNIFAEQINRDTIIRDPTSHLKGIPRPPKTLLQREEEYYSESEVQAFFKQSMHPAYRMAFLGLYLTGMRFEELASLTWEYVDLNSRLLKIRSRENFKTKTPTSERDIPLSDLLFQELNHIQHKNKEDCVFHSRQGTKLRERRTLEICKKVAAEAGISKTANLHKFRHTFSSLLSQYGVAYEVREYLLGHKPTGSLTGHYTKLNSNNYHGVVSLLDKNIKNNHSPIENER